MRKTDFMLKAYAKAALRISTALLAVFLTYPQNASAEIPGGFDVHYAFDGNADSSTGNYNATVTGNAAYFAGKIGQAFSFARGSYVNSLYPISPNTSGVTFSTWAYIDTTASGQPVFITTGSDGGHIVFKYSVGSGISFNALLTSGWYNASVAESAVPKGQWFHLAGVYDKGGSIKIFINGELKATTRVPDESLQTSGIPTQIGTYNSGQDGNFLGKMDDFRIFNRPLNDSTIKEIFNTNNVAPVANFITSTTSGPAPLSVVFTDRSTDEDGNISKYLWDFGDGTTSTASSFSKTYNASGRYTVTLTVTDIGGKTSTKTQMITVDFAAAETNANSIVTTTLNAGWNLITIPVELSLKPSELASRLEYVKQPVEQNMFTYKDASYSIPSAYEGCQGVWVNIAYPALTPKQTQSQVQWMGQRCTPRLTDLSKGWHLLGTGVALNNVLMTYNFKALYTLEQGSFKINPARVNAGQGFWLAVDAMTYSSKNRSESKSVFSGKSFTNDPKLKLQNGNMFISGALTTARFCMAETDTSSPGVLVCAGNGVQSIKIRKGNTDACSMGSGFTNSARTEVWRWNPEKRNSCEYVQLPKFNYEFDITSERSGGLNRIIFTSYNDYVFSTSTNCTDCNLSDFDFNLVGKNLRGANLKGSDLSGANLSNQDLSDAELSGANLSSADLTGARLGKANLSVGLKGAKLFAVPVIAPEAIFKKADLNGTQFMGTILDCADLSNIVALDASLFNNARFYGDKARNCRTDFSNSELDGIILSRDWSNKVLVGTKHSLPNYERINAENAVLSFRDFSGFYFVRSNFKNADLSGANFTSVRCPDCVFDFASIDGLNLTSSYMLGASFKSLNSLKQVNFTNARLPETDFSNNDLREYRFSQQFSDSSTFKNTLMYSDTLPVASWKTHDIEGSSIYMKSPIRNIDFQNAKLAYVKFYPVGKDKIEITNSNFTNANMDGIEIASARLTANTFNATRLNYARMHNVDMTDSRATGAYLIGAKANYMFWPNAVLDNAHLSSGLFTNSTFNNNANFSRANMVGTRFTKSVLVGVDMSNTFIDGAIFDDAIMLNVNLSGAQQNDSQPVMTTFINTLLAGVNFRDARLQSADFTNAVFNMSGSRYYNYLVYTSSDTTQTLQANAFEMDKTILFNTLALRAITCPDGRGGPCSNDDRFKTLDPPAYMGFKDPNAEYCTEGDAKCLDLQKALGQDILNMIKP